MQSDIGAFAIVPLWLIRRGISSTAVHLFATLAAAYCDRAGKAWPSRQTIAEEMGCSTDTVDRAVKELVSVGALIKERRWHTQHAGQKSNFYSLRFAKPGEHADNEPQQEPHPSGPCDPQNQGSNHTQLEPNKDTTPYGVAPQRDRRVNLGDVFGPFKQKWSAMYPGVKLEFTGRHGKLGKELLLLYSPDELARRMDVFFASSHAYYAEHRHDFATFANDINRFVPEASAAAPAVPVPPPVGKTVESDPATEKLMAAMRERREARRKGGTGGGTPEEGTTASGPR